MHDAARGLERLALIRVRDRHAMARAVAEPCADLLAVPREVHDELADARVREPLHMVLDQRAAADLEQRLRRRVGQRPQALAAAGREQQRTRQHRASSHAASSWNSGWRAAARRA